MRAVESHRRRLESHVHAVAATIVIIVILTLIINIIIQSFSYMIFCLHHIWCKRLIPLQPSAGIGRAVTSGSRFGILRRTLATKTGKQPGDVSSILFY